MLPYLDAGVVFEEAHRLNTPLWMAVVVPKEEAVREEYPVACEAFNSSVFVQIDARNVVVGAFKQAEDNNNVFILRIHEDRGDRIVAKLRFCFGLAPHAVTRTVDAVKVVNTLEEETGEPVAFNAETQEVTVTLRPYKILSLALHFS